MARLLGRIGALVLAGAAIGALSACDMNPSPMAATQADLRKEARAETVRFLHGVTFAPGSAALSFDEAAKLTRFAQSQVLAGDEVVLVADQRGLAVQQARMASIHNVLEANGVRVIGTSRTSEIALGPDSVLVATTRYVARTPGCPNWSKLTNYDPNNEDHSNYGCASAINLSKQVANPRDLATGRDPGPADGTRAALAIDRYRRDQVKQPVAVGTGSGAPTSAVAGGGSGGGSGN